MSFQGEISASSFADSMERAPSPEQPQHAPEGTVCVSISRTTALPNDLAVARCHRLPEYGPRILFFSGGSALRQLSETIKEYTHNSIHLITPFDSGGSSAEIRKAFGMLSVGDLRNRLMALSDDSTLGNPNVIQLFSYRLSKHQPLLAQSEFRDVLSGRHPLCQAVSLPMRSILTSHLRWFANRMPADFDLCGASIGNLIITGCFLEHSRDIVVAIYLIWKLLGVKGKVRPLTAANLQLRAHYENGEIEVGQHLLGKHKSVKKIVRIDLVNSIRPNKNGESVEQQAPQTCHIDRVSAELVNSADVLCYPMGSFFGSLLVNLLPRGVGRSIVGRHCPKIYIPNTGQDPEMFGYTLTDCIQKIVEMVQHDIAIDNGPATPPLARDVLNFVLLDTTHCEYCIEINPDEIVAQFGIQVVDICLVNEKTKAAVENSLQKARELDPVKVAEVLLTLGS